MNDDYIVQIKVKNGHLLRAMRRCGIFTASELARRVSASPGKIGDYLNLKAKAVDKTGMWTPCVMRIADLLRVMPSALFPPQHIDAVLKRNTAEISVNAERLETIAAPYKGVEQLVIIQEVNTDLFKHLKLLDPRAQSIVRMRFGVDGKEMTYKEIAEKLHVSLERIRQIEAKALRILRGRMCRDG